MEKQEFVEVLKQELAHFSERMRDRDLQYMQQINELNRQSDRTEGKATDAISRTETIFQYIDKLKDIGPKADMMLDKVDEMLESVKDHENRLRDMEQHRGQCVSHAEKTADHEERVRELESIISKLVGGLRLWGGLLATSTVLISIIALFVAIYK